jgi:hypothetical protein
MEVSVRPITVTEELAAVGRTRARRCRAAPSERDAVAADRAGRGIEGESAAPFVTSLGK